MEKKMSRVVVVLHDHHDIENETSDLLKELAKFKTADKIFLAVEDGIECKVDFASILGDASACLKWPKEYDNNPKIRNWITKKIKEQEKCDFLHVIQDNTEILKDPNVFMSQLECMMDVFDYPIWLSTISDGCNYTYSKYNPRLRIKLDNPQVNSKWSLGENIVFTSHSNTQWVAYDFKIATDDNLLFDESFTIPMFYIIEFLARRRNTSDSSSLCFMNQYMTVDSEVGVFKCLKCKEDDVNVKMQEEDAVFKSKNINYTPDNNVDLVLERLWLKLKSKM